MSENGVLGFGQRVVGGWGGGIGAREQRWRRLSRWRWRGEEVR